MPAWYGCRVFALGRNAPLRAAFAGFLALLFSLAPLICIRFCELRHWSLAGQAVVSLHDTPHAMAHHGHSAHQVPEPAAHHAPLNEFGDMLRAIVELLPIAVVAIAILVSRMLRCAVMLQPFMPGSAPRTPPPRFGPALLFV